MASRRKPTEAAGKGEARVGSKPAARTPANKKAPAKSSAAPTAKVTGAGDEDNGAKGLIHAGLKALGTVRDDVVMRQSSMIDSLLGIGGAKAADRTDASAGVLPRSLKSLDPFGGLRKFEDVFDQRVATSLEHLGLPSAEDMAALQAQVKQLREEVEALKRVIVDSAATGAGRATSAADAEGAKTPRRKR